MATIKYLLQGTSNPSPIYLRLSLGRGKVLKRKSGYIINPKNWSQRTGYPKQTQAEFKNLKSNLIGLESDILKKFNDDFSTGKDINGEWLENTIAGIQNREKSDDFDYLLNYTESFIEKLPFSYNKSGKKISEATFKKYKTILNKLVGFESHKNKRFKLKDVNLKFRADFIEYLSEKEKINDNTIGRYISFIKTIVYDARKHGYEVSHQISDFKGFTVSPPIVTLNFEELEKIKKVTLKDEVLDIARDWLIIGCYVGQRVSDLLRMSNNMIQNIQGYQFIVINQVKTNKKVQIPIHAEVKAILDKYNGNFPPTFASTPASNSALFNRHIKKVCLKAGLTEKVEGSLINPETQRKEVGRYEKWKLISSHVCRRSFATNFYSKRKYPTPLLMNVTGHSTETMFLNYIGKKPIDYSLQLAEIWNND